MRLTNFLPPALHQSVISSLQTQAVLLFTTTFAVGGVTAARVCPLRVTLGRSSVRQGILTPTETVKPPLHWWGAWWRGM